MRFVLFVLAVLIMAGCTRMNSSNDGLIQSYAAPMVESTWIRNGDPIEFEKHRWYPIDDIETLLDNEVFQVAEYKGVPIFVEKVDARPFDRLYTKFGKNKFRYFERSPND